MSIDSNVPDLKPLWRFRWRKSIHWTPARVPESASRSEGNVPLVFIKTSSEHMRSTAKQPNAGSTIAELHDAHPVTARVLLRRGMACVGCTMAPFETLAEAAREYGVGLNRLLDELGIAPISSRRQTARNADRERRSARRRRRETEP